MENLKLLEDENKVGYFRYSAKYKLEKELSREEVKAVLKFINKHIDGIKRRGDRTFDGKTTNNTYRMLEDATAKDIYTYKELKLPTGETIKSVPPQNGRQTDDDQSPGDHHQGVVLVQTGKGGLLFCKCFHLIEVKARVRTRDRRGATYKFSKYNSEQSLRFALFRLYKEPPGSTPGNTTLPAADAATGPKLYSEDEMSVYVTRSIRFITGRAFKIPGSALNDQGQFDYAKFYLYPSDRAMKRGQVTHSLEDVDVRTV